MQHPLNFLGFILVVLTCKVAEASAGCACCCEAGHAWRGSAPSAVKLQWLNSSVLHRCRHIVRSGFPEELAIEFYMQRKVVEEYIV